MAGRPGGGTIRARAVGPAGQPEGAPLTVDPADRTRRLERDADGRANVITVAAEASPTRRAVLLGGDSGGDPAAARIVEVVVDGWRFEVEVEAERRASLRERASRDRAAISHGAATEVHAIIPGRVVAVSVAPGDAVTAGQQLLVVEAMKMQNEVRTPRAGTVERLAVGEGQTIERGDLLAVIGGSL